MVKKPKVREEQFQQVKAQIEYWEKQLVLNKQMQKDLIKARNTQRRYLNQLHKRYDKQ